MAKNSLFSSRPYGVWDRMGTTTSLGVNDIFLLSYNLQVMVGWLVHVLLLCLSIICNIIDNTKKNVSIFVAEAC